MINIATTTRQKATGKIHLSKVLRLLSRNPEPFTRSAIRRAAIRIQKRAGAA